MDEYFEEALAREHARVQEIWTDYCDLSPDGAAHPTAVQLAALLNEVTASLHPPDGAAQRALYHRLCAVEGY